MRFRMALNECGSELANSSHTECLLDMRIAYWNSIYHQTFRMALNHMTVLVWHVRDMRIPYWNSLYQTCI